MHRTSAEALRAAFDGSFALPQRDPTRDAVDLLAIRVGRAGYALRVSEIGAVATGRRITPLPSSHPALRGLVGLRGTLVAVFDLATLLEEPSVEEAPRWLAVCGGATQVALAFHAVEGHLRLAPSALEATPPERGSLVEHLMRSDGELRPVASVPRILGVVLERGRERPRKAD